MLSRQLWHHCNETRLTHHPNVYTGEKGIHSMNPSYHYYSLGQNQRCLEPCDIEMWWMTLKNNIAPLLCYFKLCFVHHSNPLLNSNWSYGPETTKLGFDLCDLDLWPLTLTFCMDCDSVIVITNEHFMMIWWSEHGEKCVTDGQTERTDGRTEPFTELLGRS